MRCVFCGTMNMDCRHRTLFCWRDKYRTPSFSCQTKNARSCAAAACPCRAVSTSGAGEDLCPLASREPYLRVKAALHLLQTYFGRSWTA